MSKDNEVETYHLHEVKHPNGYTYWTYIKQQDETNTP